MGIAATVLTFGAAQLAARLAARRGLIGGGIILAMLTTGAASIALGGILLPTGLDLVLFCLTGVLIGADVDRTNLLALRGVAVAAVLSGGLLIGAGILVARALEPLRLMPDGGLLATSPGGLHVMVAAAIEHGFDAPGVALFHMTRLFLVVLAIPILLRLLPGPTSSAGSRPNAPASGAPSSPVAVVHDAPAGVRGLPVPALAGGALGGVGALGLLGGSPLAVLSAAVVGSAVANLAWPSSRPMPRFRHAPGLFVQAGIGWLIGRLFTLESLGGLGRILAGALVAGVLSVLSGVLVALLLRLVRLQPGSDMLATAPGAVEVLPLLADPRNTAPVVVALFHFVRVLMVLAAVPLLLMLER